jgi:multidrug resistance efflux pump
MEAVIEAIERELRALDAERHALRADYEREEQRLDTRRQALERARELLEHALTDSPLATHAASNARQPDGPDAEAVAHLYPPTSTTTRTTNR